MPGVDVRPVRLHRVPTPVITPVPTPPKWRPCERLANPVIPAQMREFLLGRLDPVAPDPIPAPRLEPPVPSVRVCRECGQSLPRT